MVDHHVLKSKSEYIQLQYKHLKVFSRLLSFVNSFENGDAPTALVIASQFLSFRKVLFVPLPRVFSHVLLIRQPLFAHFLSRFFYTQDMCNLEFDIVFGIFVSLPILHKRCGPLRDLCTSPIW